MKQDAIIRGFGTQLEDLSRDEAGLSIVDVTKSFGKREVLHGISISIRPGETVGLLGRDGAGKSVTFYLIVGLIKPTSGRIMLNGEDVTRLPMYRRAILGLGYLPQETSIFRGMTVAQNILAMLELVEPDRALAMQRLENLLEEFDIQHLRNSPATSLSGGERRRCEIARSLALDPRFMLLDEPFAGIDPLTIASIKGLVTDMKRRGITLLITDHNVHDIFNLIDRVYILHEGDLIFEGSPAAMLEDETVRRVYLGSDFSL